MPLMHFPDWMIKSHHVGYKRCSKTNKIHLLSDFHRDKSQPDGHRRDCSECCAQRSAKRYALNHEQLRRQATERSKTPEYKSKRDARRARNRDRINAQSKAFVRLNPEKSRSYQKRWRDKNPESNRARRKAWAAANPLAVRNHQAQRRALLKGARLCRITTEQIAQRISVFGGMCAYCPATWSHLDHVIPLTRGGPHCLANLRPACAHCNLTKHNKPAKQWLREIGRLK